MSRNRKRRLPTPCPPTSQTSNPRPTSHDGRLARISRRLSSGWVLLLYWLALFTATHWPAEFRAGPPMLGVPRDNIIHALVYMPLLWMLNGFLGRLSAGSVLRRHSLLLAVPALIAWAAIDEITQTPVGRSASFRDWLGDVTGVLFAAGVVLVVRWRRQLANRTTDLSLQPQPKQV